MKFSEAWLREWVSPDLTTQALVEQLTMAGLEVDGVEAVAGSFSDVVIARVVDAQPHPDADKLRVCQVDDGETTHTVVCGAPNAREGIQVAYARVGAKLPDGTKIRRAKLRGVESAGMLCSAAELGLGDDHDGIIELPSALTKGAALRDQLNLDDISIDVDLTPNRGDCLGIKGLAREVGLLNNLSVNVPPIAAVAATHDTRFAVRLEAPAGCPRYLGRVVKNINPQAQTPLWMVEKLRRSGIRSIDPTVDITNYVLLELGQPMHAFDLEVLNDAINVRMAAAGERLTLLDGRDVELDTNTLLITDAAGPVAIAGVMGGARSGISATTNDVFLECAYFNPLAIAGTARRYGLHTEASQRYERGVDFELQEQAMERATQLLLDICGGDAGPVEITEQHSELPERAAVSVRHSRLEALIGVTIAPAEVDRVFAQLQFEIVARDDASGGDIRWTIQAPSHRFDIAYEADLVEEVCRVYGYNNIPPRQTRVAQTLGRVPITLTPERRLRDYLADQGYLETVTYSFIDPSLHDLLAPNTPSMRLTNPLSTDLSVMRTSLVPGLVSAMQANIARQATRLRLFEVGLCFQPKADDDGTELVQTQTLGGLLWGRRVPQSWGSADEPVDFFDAKGDLEAVLEAFGADSLQLEPGVDPIFHPGQFAVIVDANGTQVGRLGRLHPSIEAELDGEQGVYLFEIATAALLARAKPRYEAVSKFPSVRRDLAIVLAREVTAGAVERVVRDALQEILVDFTLFDVYTGKGIDSNEKSLALGLTLQAPSATLTDIEIGAHVERVTQALQQQLGARLR